MADLTVPWRIICFLVVTDWFLCTEAANDDMRIVLCSCGTPPRNLSAMPYFLECALYIPVSRLLGRSGFGDAVGCVDDDNSNDIQDITFLGGFSMWNDAAVCGGRIWLKVFVSVWSDMWKYRERESVMIFSVPLMCCEYRDVSLLTRVHPIQKATESCDSTFTRSKDALCIQPSALGLSMNATMFDPCPSCRMVM